MNNRDMERDLLNNGFSQKDILAMRKHLGEKGVTYLTLLAELNGRFLMSCFLIILIFIGLIYTISVEDRDGIIGYAIAMLVAAPIFYILTPLTLGFKAFMYRRKS